MTVETHTVRRKRHSKRGCTPVPAPRHRENPLKNREIDREVQIIRKNYDCVMRVHRARMPLLPRKPRPLKRGVPCAPQLSRVGPRAPAPSTAWVSASREPAERVQCTRADGGASCPHALLLDVAQGAKVLLDPPFEGFDLRRWGNQGRIAPNLLLQGLA